MWHLYVLRCNDGSFYAGITNDITRRVKEHQAGRGARYTRSHLPVTLVAVWDFPDRSSATRAEIQFKRLYRKTKEAWVEGRWPFMDAPFSFAIFDDPHPHHFCPRCGGRLVWSVRHDGGVQTCTVCGRHHYANAKPCSGAMIVRDHKVLLVRRAREPYRGYWDIPGGFLGADELPEAGAIRETREETGLEIRILGFLGFYIDHYVYQDEVYTTLISYFVAESQPGELAGDDETDGFGWFPLDAPPVDIAFEHAPQALRDLHTWWERWESTR